MRSRDNLLPRQLAASKNVERAAYIAAHRILDADTMARSLACPGGQRTYAVDLIAAIISEVFERYQPVEQTGRPYLVNRRYGAAARVI